MCARIRMNTSLPPRRRDAYSSHFICQCVIERKGLPWCILGWSRLWTSFPILIITETSADVWALLVTVCSAYGKLWRWVGIFKWRWLSDDLGRRRLELPHFVGNVFKHDTWLEILNGLRFSTDDELEYATEERLNEQSELFYFAVVEKLRDRY